AGGEPKSRPTDRRGCRPPTADRANCGDELARGFCGSETVVRWALAFRGHLGAGAHAGAAGPREEANGNPEPAAAAGARQRPGALSPSVLKRMPDRVIPAPRSESGHPSAAGTGTLGGSPRM